MSLTIEVGHSAPFCFMFECETKKRRCKTKLSSARHTASYVRLKLERSDSFKFSPKISLTPLNNVFHRTSGILVCQAPVRWPAPHPASMPTRDLPALPCRAPARMRALLLHLTAASAPYNVAPFCVCHHFSSQLCRDAVCRCNASQQQKASVVLCLYGFRRAPACLAVPRSRTLSLVLHVT